jgi:ABC-2 type transport system permease protein
MRISQKVLYLELKNFLSGRAVLLGFLGLALLALYGYFHGDQVVSRQEKTLAVVPKVQQDHLKQVLEHGQGKAAGTTAYYPFYYTVNPPTPWARFSIGQRDVNPFTLKTKMLALEGQLYDAELTNPLTLLVGNLDGAFVFVFLFPLLIIAFTYNVFSEEQENGVWKMVRTSTAYLGSLIAAKLVIRLGTILFTCLTLFLTGILYLGLPFSAPTWQLLAIVLAYTTFWFVLCVAVLSLGKSSSFNATTLVALWIFLCVLFPGIANILINKQIPIPEAAETAIRQREGYHAKWDLPKKPTMETFYAAYPQYRKYPISEDRYSAGWYYAMQYSGDAESQRSSQSLFDKLAQRQRLSENFGLFNPAVATQQLMNKVANTDLANHVQYLQSVRQHHRRIREYFYPYIFEDTPTEEIDWTGFTPYAPIGYTHHSLTAGLLAVLVLGSLLLALSIFSIKKNLIHQT